MIIDPKFTNARLEPGSSYYTTDYGNQIECQFVSDPIRFERTGPYSSSLVEMSQSDKRVEENLMMNEFVLGFWQDNQLLMQTPLHKKTVELVTNERMETEKRVDARASISVDTNLLDHTKTYKCCLELSSIISSSDSSSKLCSYLRFDKNEQVIESRVKDSADQFFHTDRPLFEVSRVFQPPVEIHSDSLSDNLQPSGYFVRDLIIAILLFAVFATVIVTLTWRFFTLRDILINRQAGPLLDDASDFSAPNAHLYSLNHQGHHVAAGNLYDDLYVRYNLGACLHDDDHIPAGVPAPPSYDQCQIQLEK